MKHLIPSMFSIFSILVLLQLCSARARPLSKSEPSLIRLKNIDLIENTCKSTSNYELCISVLKSDPRSLEATDVDVLGLIIVDEIKSKANSAMEIIKKLRISSNPEFNVALFECSIQYNAILNADVPVAIEALTKGVPKFAESGMADAAVEAQGCENSFRVRGGSNSPLTDINQAVFDLSGIAKSIIKMLL
ncbi:hypothetical protein M9H77_36952 [Catharanthus roseus]|uniref:Uncharacterized protein n=1 Tax=Catharanthus roseus TaxID=4058 RepID=A0ACB9ZT90_CATRO|nr:hypothetical protein M9H77_36952 [Catharanthus roseus]